MSAATVWFPAPTASGPLYEIRRQRGLSRRQLSERSGVAVRTIARLERSVDGQPYRSTLAALAHALGVQTEDLEAGHGQQSAESRAAARPIRADRPAAAACDLSQHERQVVREARS
jgi:transcriptional regulator with XRE-family HTH domain